MEEELLVSKADSQNNQQLYTVSIDGPNQQNEPTLDVPKKRDMKNFVITPLEATDHLSLDQLLLGTPNQQQLNQSLFQHQPSQPMQIPSQSNMDHLSSQPSSQVLQIPSSQMLNLSNTSPKTQDNLLAPQSSRKKLLMSEKRLTMTLMRQTTMGLSQKMEQQRQQFKQNEQKKKASDMENYKKEMEEDKEYIRKIRNRKQPKDDGPLISHMQISDIKTQINQEQLEHWIKVADDITFMNREREEQYNPKPEMLEIKKIIPILRKPKRTMSCNGDQLIPQRSEAIYKKHQNKVSFKNNISFGGVDDLRVELGKTNGRKPFFEYPPVLFQQQEQQYEVNPEDETSSLYRPPSKWRELYKLVDENSAWSSQLPYMRDALGRAESYELVYQKIMQKLTDGEKLKRYDLYIEEEIERNALKEYKRKRDVELRKKYITGSVVNFVNAGGAHIKGKKGHSQQQKLKQMEIQRHLELISKKANQSRQEKEQQQIRYMETRQRVNQEFLTIKAAVESNKMTIEQANEIILEHSKKINQDILKSVRQASKAEETHQILKVVKNSISPRIIAKSVSPHKPDLKQSPSVGIASVNTLKKNSHQSVSRLEVSKASPLQSQGRRQSVQTNHNFSASFKNLLQRQISANQPQTQNSFAQQINDKTVTLMPRERLISIDDVEKQQDYILQEGSMLLVNQIDTTLGQTLEKEHELDHKFNVESFNLMSNKMNQSQLVIQEEKLESETPMNVQQKYKRPLSSIKGGQRIIQLEEIGPSEAGTTFLKSSKSQAKNMAPHSRTNAASITQSPTKQIRRKTKSNLSSYLNQPDPISQICRDTSFLKYYRNFKAQKQSGIQFQHSGVCIPALVTTGAISSHQLSVTDIQSPSADSLITYNTGLYRRLLNLQKQQLKQNDYSPMNKVSSFNGNSSIHLRSTAMTPHNQSSYIDTASQYQKLTPNQPFNHNETQPLLETQTMLQTPSNISQSQLSNQKHYRRRSDLVLTNQIALNQASPDLISQKNGSNNIKHMISPPEINQPNFFQNSYLNAQLPQSVGGRRTTSELNTHQLAPPSTAVSNFPSTTAVSSYAVTQRSGVKITPTNTTPNSKQVNRKLVKPRLNLSALN